MVRPFVSKMTKSELMAVMTGGFATVSGGVLAIYVSWLTDIQGIAGHLIAASVMSAPAALVVAKIIYPETDESQTMGDVNVNKKMKMFNRYFYDILLKINHKNNENFELIPGSLLEVTVSFNIRNSLGVPDTSIILEGDKAYVYKVIKIKI